MIWDNGGGALIDGLDAATSIVVNNRLLGNRFGPMSLADDDDTNNNGRLTLARESERDYRVITQQKQQEQDMKERTMMLLG